MQSPLAAFAAFALALVSPSIAAAGDWHLSLEPLFGSKYGELGEYVFLKDCSYASDKLSELDWDYKPLWYAGAKVNAGWRAIEANASFTAAIPGKTGLMYDSDWVNTQLSGTENYQYKTNYTESDSYLTKNYTWDIKSGYRFSLSPRLSIKPFFAYEYNYISFDGRGLSGWYGKKVSSPTRYAPYTDENNREYKSASSDLTVISYKRESNIFWLGCEAGFLLPRHFSCRAGCQLSPYIYTVSIDDHYYNTESGTGTEYADVCDGAFSLLKLYASLDYEINRQLSLSLYASYLFYFQPLRGDNYNKSIGATSYAQSDDADGGASEWTVDCGLSVRYRFF